MSKSGKFSLSPFSRVFHFLIVAIFLLGILPVPALAQANGTIAGQVTDNSTGNPVPSALVLISESGSQPPTWNGSTDTSGNYSIPTAEGSNYQVAAYKEGYITGQIGGQNVTANTTTTVVTMRSVAVAALRSLPVAALVSMLPPMNGLWLPSLQVTVKPKP